MNTRLITVLVMVASSLLLCTATAQSINGTYILVKDSDGSAPKKNATVTLIFIGGNTGTLAMSAVQPGEIVTDTGNYSIHNSLITIEFKEMEWEAKEQSFSLAGCTLTLPFKALSGSSGPGTSTWLKQGCSANSGGGSPTPQAMNTPDQPLAQQNSLAQEQPNLAPQAQQQPAQPGDKPAERPTQPERPVRPERPSRSVCGCRDIDYLNKRSVTASIAINKYMEIALKFQNADEASGKQTMYSEKAEQDVDAQVQWTIENIDKLNPLFRPVPPEENTPAANYGKSTPKSIAITNGGDCSITINNDDACHYAVLESHEKVHQAACKAYHANDTLHAPWDGLLPGRHTDYKESMTMAEFADEEARAYKAESQYIQDTLATLKNCWTCDVDKKSYTDKSVCEQSCRPTLGSTMKLFGSRCTHPK